MDSSYFQNDSERNVTIFVVIYMVVLVVGGVFVVDAIARCHVKLYELNQQRRNVLTHEQILGQMLMGPVQKFCQGSTTLPRGRAEDDDDDHHDDDNDADDDDNHHDDDNDDHPECMICVSDFVEGEEIKMLSRCNHVFHAKCIHRWFLSGKSSCPICRDCCRKIPFNQNQPAESSQQRQQPLNDAVINIEAAMYSGPEIVGPRA